MPETVLVTGATGLQGGSVARHLLASGRRVRALTRRAQTPAARALAELGAELVQADISDLGALCGALEGCDALFGVTNYWEHFGTEISHGHNLVDAASRAKPRKVLLSTLPSPEAISGGQLAVPHMDSKAAIEAYARRSGLQASFLHVAFYFENFLSWFVPRADPSGLLRFGFPQGATPLAGLAIADLGPFVGRLLDEPARFRGQTVGVVGDELSGDDYARAMTSALGREVRYEHIDRAQYAELPFPGSQDLAAMFDFNRRFIPTRARDIQLTRELVPNAQTFAAWAHTHREALARAIGAAG